MSSSRASESAATGAPSSSAAADLRQDPEHNTLPSTDPHAASATAHGGDQNSAAASPTITPRSALSTGFEEDAQVVVGAEALRAAADGYSSSLANDALLAPSMSLVGGEEVLSGIAEGTEQEAVVVHLLQAGAAQSADSRARPPSQAPTTWRIDEKAFTEPTIELDVTDDELRRRQTAAIPAIKQALDVEGKSSFDDAVSLLCDYFLGPQSELYDLLRRGSDLSNSDLDAFLATFFYLSGRGTSAKAAYDDRRQDMEGFVSHETWNRVWKRLGSVLYRYIRFLSSVKKSKILIRDHIIQPAYAIHDIHSIKPTQGKGAGDKDLSLSRFRQGLVHAGCADISDFSLP